MDRVIRVLLTKEVEWSHDVMIHYLRWGFFSLNVELQFPPDFDFGKFKKKRRSDDIRSWPNTIKLLCDNLYHEWNVIKRTIIITQYYMVYFWNWLQLNSHYMVLIRVTLIIAQVLDTFKPKFIFFFSFFSLHFWNFFQWNVIQQMKSMAWLKVTKRIFTMCNMGNASNYYHKYNWPVIQMSLNLNLYWRQSLQHCLGPVYKQ